MMSADVASPCSECVEIHVSCGSAGGVVYMCGVGGSCTETETSQTGCSASSVKKSYAVEGAWEGANPVQ